MARFDVYANPDASDRKRIPFLLDVQHHHLHELHTHMVVPLWLHGSMPGVIQRLNPELKVAGKTVVMDTSSLGAVPMAELRKPVDNLAAQQLTIQTPGHALRFLLT
ncbi:plasmid maintenance protein CcdB [Ramlibacter terrae]|uniref:Toxin CcdB n=1 Tax=Ramlibacter terrae TaxID=2732511 RepID=A0ABX6P3K6_9BURK|nr:plasmid maintenance protein CcdB [Ramlibacter terrae]